MLFVANEPTIENLGDGITISLTPTVMPDGNLEIKTAMEKRNATGKKTVTAMPTVTAQLNRAVETSFGKTRIRFIPKMKGK